MPRDLFGIEKTVSVSCHLAPRPGHEESSKEFFRVLPLAVRATEDGCVCPGRLPAPSQPNEDVQSGYKAFAKGRKPAAQRHDPSPGDIACQLF